MASDPEKFSVPGGLIPAEVEARFKRTKDGFPDPKATGSTVDQEGLTNNYAVDPERSVAEATPLKTKLWQAVAFAAVTWIPISIAIIVSR
ncbi:hypothetical protein C1752_01082 [Acaryochloris thomasi RCC1774]|uniref:Uncharacterized protein n=1 Tax=Acaryochloris thomasi RCC1774 TaxID=1764569 RepID=A0A2W1JNK5_9CYAN|nr:hypothetical protein [Acaryochloris thomasi]PZD74920.1 hypothetical protein C1752_01082 [Acaryochloris thomasi RCC1774]